MPSYTSYLRQMSVLDADDDIQWITVRGNHIPIKKGENKEDAIKSFFESKGKESKKDTGSIIKQSKVEMTNGLKHITHTTPEGYKFSVWESSNDPGWKTNNLPADYFETEAEATEAATKQFEKDLEYYNSGEANKKGKQIFEEKYGTKKTETQKLNDFFGTGEQHATTRNIMTLFSKHYEDLYDGKTKYNRELVKEFDDKMANDPEFKKQVQAFVRERGDVLSSDREVQAYMMAYNTTKSKLEPAMKKLERAHGQTIGRLKEAGKDISKLQQAMQHINYGFYEEQGKNMTPEQLVDYLQGEIDKSYGKKDYYSSRAQTRYPEAIKLVKEYINGGEKKSPTSKKKKEPAIVREGGVNWVDEKAWNDPRSDPWYALYE